MSTSEQTHSQAEARAWLEKHLPSWTAEEKSISRRYRTNGWKATMMLANAVAHLAEVAWHHPDMALGYDSVTVRLSTHTAGGITGKDFALASQIEAVVGWKPAPPLEGAPGDDKAAGVLKRG